MRLHEAWAGPVEVETVCAWLKEMKPEDATQAMLAAQMIGTHHAFASSLRFAADVPKSPAHPDVQLTRATRLGRLYIEQMEAIGSKENIGSRR
jgi:hypothetical protein